MQNAKTLSIPEAGKLYFDLGRNASYEAARRGDFPSIRIGARLRVPVAALERMVAGPGRATVEDPTRISEDERSNFVELSLQKRVALAREYLHAVGVSLDQLRAFERSAT